MNRPYTRIFWWLSGAGAGACLSWVQPAPMDDVRWGVLFAAACVAFAMAAALGELDHTLPGDDPPGTPEEVPYGDR